MNKENYINIINKKVDGNARNIMLEQLDNYYEASKYVLPKHKYSLGDKVYLKKGTFLHGTFKNIKGLEEIVNNGLKSNWFINGRLTKYPSCVGVWNLKQDYYLKDYINFYSGGTLDVSTIKGKRITKVIPYDEVHKLIKTICKERNHFRWILEQTKEARFLPSLIQDTVQIGIIMNTTSKEIKKLSRNDILSTKIKNKDVASFVNPDYLKKFLKDRKHKDDFFTDRESAILFGIPANFIEGVLVGRKYEKSKRMLAKIKELLPNAYICNLDGIVIEI